MCVGVQGSMESEERKRESEEQKKRDEEERAEIEAAQKKWNDLIRSRMEFMRKLGRPCKIVRMNRPIDVRNLLNRESNCDKIDWGDGPVEPEVLLERERVFWNAAMEYRRIQNMDSEYDLIPSNMTLSPIMSVNGIWYHGNLVGCKRQFPSKGVQQYFFLKVHACFSVCLERDDDAMSLV